MSLILALDTSTEACSCALIKDGGIREDFALIPRQHTQRILPMIRQMMQDAGVAFSDLDAIAFGKGPGSFTGLRIAAGVTQGIAMAAQLPVIGVSTLEAMALEAGEQAESGCILACLDARIDEIYWALYSLVDGLPQVLMAESLGKPEALPTPQEGGLDRLLAVGNGLNYRERFPDPWRAALSRELPDILPRAGHMARLAALAFQRGEVMTAEEVAPLYLRDKVTHSQG